MRPPSRPSPVMRSVLARGLRTVAVSIALGLVAGYAGAHESKGTTHGGPGLLPPALRLAVTR